MHKTRSMLAYNHATYKYHTIISLTDISIRILAYAVNFVKYLFTIDTKHIAAFFCDSLKSHVCISNTNCQIEFVYEIHFFSWVCICFTINF